MTAPTAFTDWMEKFLKHARLIEANETESLILKGHLATENLLRDILNAKNANPSKLLKARLTFSQLTYVLEAQVEPEKSWQQAFSACRKLNKLRNELSHNIDTNRIDELLNDFLTSVKRIERLSIGDNLNIGTFDDSDDVKRDIQILISMLMSFLNLLNTVDTEL